MMTTRRGLSFALAAPAALLLLAACGAGGPTDVPGTAAPVGVTSPAAASATPATSEPVTSTPATSAPATSAPATTRPVTPAKGCAPGGMAIPTGAGKATTPDLDGDGRPDVIWLHDVGTTRTLGIRTAGGATFSTTFTSAAPQAATAAANTLSDGASVVLLNTGRSVQLYAVTGCRLVKSLNPQGSQYTFDLGFTGYGTGVGCPTVAGRRELVGYLAETGPGSTSTVTRTPVVLSSHGTRASNGTTTPLPSTSAVIEQARTVTCGTSRFASEPQS